jgi:hypothetical protein
MAGQRGRLTAQQEQFVRLVVEEGQSFVAAYRLAYPPRKGTRSPGAERVAAKRVAHHQLVEQRMEQLREQLLASDPVEMRRRANAVLGQILAKQLDPRYRRTAADVLKRLDEEERAKARADQEAFRTLTAQMAVLDTIENGGRARSNQAKGEEKEPPQVDLDQIIDEIDRLVQGQRLARDPEHLSMPIVETYPEDPPQVTENAIPLEANDAADRDTPPPQRGFRLVRRAGFFGKGSWMREPNPR